MGLIYSTARFVPGDDAYSQLSQLSGLLALLESETDETEAGDSYQDAEIFKKWILGSGGKAGNCSICIDNADRGWVPDDEMYEGVFGEVEEPGSHPNCTCGIKRKTKIIRVLLNLGKVLLDRFGVTLGNVAKAMGVTPGKAKSEFAKLSNAQKLETITAAVLLFPPDTLSNSLLSRLGLTLDDMAVAMGVDAGDVKSEYAKLSKAKQKSLLAAAILFLDDEEEDEDKDEED